MAQVIIAEESATTLWKLFTDVNVQLIAELCRTGHRHTRNLPRCLECRCERRDIHALFLFLIYCHQRMKLFKLTCDFLDVVFK
jgi:hypothetical protein